MTCKVYSKQSILWRGTVSSGLFSVNITTIKGTQLPNMNRYSRRSSVAQTASPQPRNTLEVTLCLVLRLKNLDDRITGRKLNTELIGV